jgi:oligopeptide/dipeptide ABC transporter ATP-binding protein
MPSSAEGSKLIMSSQTILDVAGLSTTFHVKRANKKYALKAVDNVSFHLDNGEILGFVGETGCGKTTVGRSIIKLARPEAGVVIFGGDNILGLSGRRLREVRLKVRMVFQDPYASLNPRRRIDDSVAEAGDIHKLFKSPQDRLKQIAETLKRVGLDPSFANRFPHELSGGQRQRVGIARAILPIPDIIIADEPVSALDVSIQAQILNLLLDLRKRLNLAIIFISHDLSVVGQICDRIAVMYLGRVVEIGEAEELFNRPQHPYTQALIDAVPKPNPRLRNRKGLALGEPPSRFELKPGCTYADRCPLAEGICLTEVPEIKILQNGQRAACHKL